MAAFEADPCSSQRKMAQEIETSESYVCRVLKEECVKVWKFTSVQEVLVDDPPKHAGFCRLVLDRRDTNCDFVRSICFSDVATFLLNGCVNKHNQFVYTKENPHLFIEDKMQSLTIIHLAMVSPDLGVTFKLLDTIMNNKLYRDILENIVFLIFTKRRNSNKIYQQDDAPPHFATLVRDSLNHHLSNRWIHRVGLIILVSKESESFASDIWLWG